jgi:O-antigen ligase
MTGSLLCCLFAANYSFGRARDLIWWSAFAIIPVIALTRMGILAAGVSLPLTFAPLNFAKRFVFIFLIFIAGLFVFSTERVQQKMFYGGSGTIQDVRLENPNFATSGRTVMWDALRYEIGKEPWFGHGANGDEVFLFRLFNANTQPHNDWLRLTYNYGYIGVILFGITLLMQLFHAFTRGRNSSGETRTLFYVGASSFLIFSLFMISDNIIYYAAFFGNLQFTILGLAYAAHNTGEASSASPKRN